MAAKLLAQYQKQSDDELKKSLIDLGLDAVGHRDTLLARLKDHLALANVDGHSQNGSAKTNDKKKRRKKKTQQDTNATATGTVVESENKPQVPQGVDIEYVAAPLDIKDEAFADYAKIFDYFQPAPPEEDEAGDQSADEADGADLGDEDETNGHRNRDSDSDSDTSEDENGVKKVSRKQMRKLNRLTVAELKQLVKKPDVVDWVDVTASDPKLLVHLKSYRNTVPVPVHWSQKRKYLQGKRGIEKPPFELPDFIKATGIMEMRSAVKEKEDAQKLKSKTRERHQPKMGKLDIDYQKLHDAFFRWQTKPKLTIHGDVYYEGKEFETKLKAKKPGQLSEELKSALNMPPLAPPPWLINMQRYGPPPSYPQLKVAGLNAPIPEGAQWGYHPGGWGKPPVDEYGRPLYGDVFGSMEDVKLELVAPIERTTWGELELEEEASEDEEEESDDENESDEDANETNEDDEAAAVSSGLVTPSGISSVPSGLETPEFIELRKDRRRSASPPAKQKQLYTVLPEKSTSVKGFMGSEHVYDLSAGASGSGKRKAVGETEVSLNPDELQSGLDSEVVRKAYERSKEGSTKEDFSDMVAEHAQREREKRKKRKTEKFKF